MIEHTPALIRFLHVSPGAAIEELHDAAVPGDRWVLAAALGAQGRYGRSLALLEALAGEATSYGSFARSTAASHYRQLGRHADAHPLDAAALELAADANALFDAHLGLAADAVGTADVDTARAHLELARAHADGWRCHVRLGWVTTEIALLTGAPDAAVRHAREALAQARAARAPRHVAKCLLFLGVSEQVAGEPDAAATLAGAAAAAAAVDARPLLWVAHAVRGGEHRAAAAAAVAWIADQLEPRDRGLWVERPDIKDLLHNGAEPSIHTGTPASPAKHYGRSDDQAGPS